MGGSFSKQSSKSSGEFDTQATFDPRADALIQSLTNQANRGEQDSAFLSQQLQQFMQSGGNPLAQGAMDSRRLAAQQGLDQNLAKVRSQGNRGGIARDVMNQAGTVSQFENQLNANELSTLANQHNANNQSYLQAGDLLRGLGSSGAGSSLGMLGLMRGSQGTNSQQSSGTSMGVSADLSGLI